MFLVYTAYSYQCFVCAVAQLPTLEICCCYLLSHDILMALCMESEFLEAQLIILVSQTHKLQ